MGTPELLSITALTELLEWYRANLRDKNLVDPRGFPVRFLDTDFVHLIKLVDKYGKEPKNRRMAIEQIESGRISQIHNRIDIQRAKERS